MANKCINLRNWSKPQQIPLESGAHLRKRAISLLTIISYVTTEIHNFLVKELMTVVNGNRQQCNQLIYYYAKYRTRKHGELNT